MSTPCRASGPAVDECAVLRIVQSTLRSLLRAGSEREAVALLIEAVRDLDGDVVPARLAIDAESVALPVDLTFGLDEPLLPTAAPGSPARAVIERFLPPLVEDVRVVVEQLRTEDRLEEDATTDPLTGLLNRRAFGRILQRLRSGGSVVAIDLDHFKALNDTQGHAAGDAVLAALGSVLRDSLRLSEHCARFGGEEFVIAFPGADAAHSAAVVERLRGEWAARRPYPVTLSAGIAEVADGESVSQVLARADRALYRAKANGRDRVERAT